MFLMRSASPKANLRFYRLGVLRFIVLFFFSFLSFTLYGQSETAKPIELSLNEAILLAIRENPNVQKVQLDYIEKKFALGVAQWQFQPQFKFTASRSITRTVAQGIEQTGNSTTIQPAVTLNTPIGTQLSLTSVNNISGHYNPALTLQIIQPLMRGFGRAIVEAALYNAIDSEIIGRLDIESALRETVTSVIKAYLDVVSAQQAIIIDEDALKRARTSVKQTQIFIKAGKKAGSELVTVQASVATAEGRLEDHRNSLKQKEYALLAAIGLNPNTSVHYTNLDIKKLIKKYSIPGLDETKQLELENDISYQIANITLNGATKRGLEIAKDNTRWQLDLTINGTTGNGSGGGANAGINSLGNGYNQTQSALLNLTIPIDDRAAQQSLLQAKIGLRESLINLKKSKWDIDTRAINDWNNIFSTERSLHFAEDAEHLQSKTYQISFQKYSYGLIDSLTLQTAQKDLITSQQSLLDARIAYLTSLVELDASTGKTLRTWDVKVRYGEESCVNY